MKGKQVYWDVIYHLTGETLDPSWLGSVFSEAKSEEGNKGLSQTGTSVFTLLGKKKLAKSAIWKAIPDSKLLKTLWKNNVVFRKQACIWSIPVDEPYAPNRAASAGRARPCLYTWWRQISSTRADTEQDSEHEYSLWTIKIAKKLSSFSHDWDVNLPFFQQSRRIPVRRQANCLLWKGCPIYAEISSHIFKLWFWQPNKTTVPGFRRCIKGLSKAYW